MSIRKRTWRPKKGKPKEVWIVDYKDLNGIRRQKTFSLKKDADRHWDIVKGELRDGIHVPEKETITVAEAGDNWIIDCEVEHELERSTIDAYKIHLEQHIKPFLGGVLLTKLSIPAIKSFQDRLRKAGRSANLIKRLTIDLGAIIGVAQDRGFISRNVVYEMRTRTRSKKKRANEGRRKRKIVVGIDIPTPAEINLMTNACTAKQRPFFVTLVFSGMRSSEMRGLPWSMVDFENNKITVMQRIDKYGVIGWPKSEEGQRTIPVPPIVMNILKEWKRVCPESPHDLVFPTASGEAQNHANVVKRLLHPIQIKAGLTVEKRVAPAESQDGDESAEEEVEEKIVTTAKYTGLHAFRHFFASWCINRKSAGGLELPAKDVQERMGHSSIQQTMDTYGHLFPDEDETESLAAASEILMPGLRAT
jgi:integrase